MILRLFGRVFALIAAGIAIKPRELSHRLGTADGDVASVEPTDAQVLPLRLVAAVFVLVGPAMAVAGRRSSSARRFLRIASAAHGPKYPHAWSLSPSLSIHRSPMSSR